MIINHSIVIVLDYKGFLGKSSNKAMKMNKKNLGFKEPKLERIFSKIKIPKEFHGKGSTWIINKKIRKNGKCKKPLFSLP